MKEQIQKEEICPYCTSNGKVMLANKNCPNCNKQTPKEKGYKYIDNNQNDDFLIDITLAKMGIDTALSELQEQHEAKIKEIREWIKDYYGLSDISGEGLKEFDKIVRD